MSTYYLKYTSPRGNSIVLDPNATDGPFMLMVQPSGFLAIPGEAQKLRGPGQVGFTGLGWQVGSKNINLQVALLASSEHQYWSLRELISSVLVIEPPSDDELLQMGELTLVRPNKPDVYLVVVPKDSPQESARPDRLSLVLDLQFEALNPYWQALKQKKLTLTAGATGLEFPLDHPWESEANTPEASINNQGSVRTPFVAKLFGEFTTGRLINQTTGEQFEIEGTVAAGDYVKVSTVYGDRYVRLYQDGVPGYTNAMSMMDLTTSTFWQFRQGTQDIRFEADSNPSGFVTLSFREQFGGL